MSNETDEQFDMSWAVGHLAETRQRYEQAKTSLDAKRATWEAEHQAEIDAVAAYKIQMERYEQVVRDQALEHFRATGEKKPHTAVEIKMWDEAQYNPAEAAGWCQFQMPALLVLDAKAYEKILRAVRDSKTLSDTHLATMPGRVVDQPKVSIARDLSAYLPVLSFGKVDTQMMEPVQS